MSDGLPRDGQELRRTLAADGFVVTQPLLSNAELVELRQAAARVFERCSRELGLEAWLARVNQVREPAEWDTAFGELRRDPRLAGIAAEALGEPVQAAWMHLVWKSPGEHLHLPWHQDRPTWPDSMRAHRAVVMWLALDDAGEGLGGLRYSLGSHLGAAPGPTVCPTVPAGACLLHTGEVLHASGPNRSARWRRAVVLVFSALGEGDEE